jgi:hypothetical protein
MTFPASNHLKNDAYFVDYVYGTFVLSFPCLGTIIVRAPTTTTSNPCTCSPSTTVNHPNKQISEIPHERIYISTHSLDIFSVPLEPSDGSLDRVLGLRQRQLVLFRLLVLEEGINVCQIFLGREGAERVRHQTGYAEIISKPLHKLCNKR